MELQEQITALEAEKKQYLGMIDNINAEKIALDQMLVDSLKSALSHRKDNLLLNNQLKLKDQEIKSLNDQLTGRHGDIDNLKLQMTELNAEIEKLNNPVEETVLT